MAKGLLRAIGGDRYETHSSGTDPAASVHPLAVEVMAEIGIDISNQRPKGVGTYLGRLPVWKLFIVCEDTEKKCPRMFPGMMNRTFWPFDDPIQFVGSAEATAEKFRATRDQLKKLIEEWLSENS